MTDREKLIELLKQIAHENCFGSIEKIVDHLLSNGVTVRRWIPVTERLPQDNDSFVLVIVSGKPRRNIELVDAIELAEFSMSDGWILEMLPEWENPNVTHWMPLPEPPEEG